MSRWISTFLLLSLAAATVHAAGLDTEKGQPGVADLVVNKALADALAQDGVARVEVTLDLTETQADIDHPTAGSGIHPAVFDLAMKAAGGPMKLEQAGRFHLLRIAATKPVVAEAVRMEEVVAVHLDDTMPVESRVGGSCPSSSTRACVQNNYFSLSANYGGTLGKVAAVGTNSATFWAYSSDNWEVLAKVLDGCGINGHWWLLASAAGTNSYTVGSRIWLQGGSLGLGSSTATNQPIIDLSLFSCN